MAQLAQRTALITGGGRGLGLSFAADLAGQGARVALMGRNKETLDAACATLVAAGPTVSVHAGDVWTLGIGNQTLTYTAGAGDDLGAVARYFQAHLPAGYTAHVSPPNPSTGAVLLEISNPAGFSLNGTGNTTGLSQQAASQNTITRSTTAADVNGTAIALTSASGASESPCATGPIGPAAAL